MIYDIPTRGLCSRGTNISIYSFFRSYNRLHGQNLLTCYTSYVITDIFLNNIDFFLNNMVYNEKFVNLLCNICYNRLDNVLHYMLYNMLNRMSLKDIQECLLKKKQNVSLKDTISFEDTIFFKDIRWFP